MKLTSVGFKASLTALACATALLGNSWQNAKVFEDDQAIAAEPTEVQAETQKLIGRWELNGISKPDSKGLLIFAPNGKLYVVDASEKTAMVAEYQVNIFNGQVYLDVNQGSLGSRVTFSFNSRGQLVIPQLLIPAALQYSNAYIGSFFLPNALYLTRISDDGKLPSDVEIIDPTPQGHRAKQAEARTYISTMNRGQQAFFHEKSYFTNSIIELGSGIPPETDNYSYQIVVLDAKKAVQNIALAKKDGLNSYTGLVYTQVLPSTGDLTSLALLCESKKPTKAKPPQFKLAPEPTCPEGYVPTGY
jgi:hypothetical protein